MKKNNQPKLSTLRTGFAMLLICGLLCGCGSEKTNSDQTSGETADTSKPAETVKKIFFSVPSPIQSAVMMKKAGVKYDKKVMNPVTSDSRYSTSFRRSVNMGIYCADLAYCNMFDQTQEALNYLNSINKLANMVGMTKVIENLGLSSRFQNNIGNKDSLMMIVSDLFRESDEFLKENQQYNTATLVLAGGWVEGLYIATNEAKTNKSADLRRLIADQKLSLNSLVALLPPTTNEQEYAAFKKQLDDLRVIFAEATFKKGDLHAESDKVNHTTTISGQGSVEISDDLLSKLTAKIAEIRTQVIK